MDRSFVIIIVDYVYDAGRAGDTHCELAQSIVPSLELSATDSAVYES